MLRDATIKKAHHFYTTQIKTSDKTLTVKEVNEGKAQTYVSCVNDLRYKHKSTHDHDYCTDNFMNKIKKLYDK